MTRQEVREFLISAGVAEPSEESITDFLNKHQSEVQKEKALAEKYKNDAIRVKDLESKLEDLSNQNLSDIELAKKETEKANAQVADLQKQMAIMQRKTALAEKGIIGEQADKLIRDDGTLDIDILGEIISERETKAKSQKEKELLDKTPNPTGGNSTKETMTDVDKLAESVGKQLASQSSSAESVVSHYI